MTGLRFLHLQVDYYISDSFGEHFYNSCKASSALNWSNATMELWHCVCMLHRSWHSCASKQHCCQICLCVYRM